MFLSSLAVGNPCGPSLVTYGVKNESVRGCSQYPSALAVTMRNAPLHCPTGFELCLEFIPQRCGLVLDRGWNSSGCRGFRVGPLPIMYAPEGRVCGLWGNAWRMCKTALSLLVANLGCTAYDLSVRPLRFSYDALEPWIDAETMRLNPGVLHGEYVASLNAVCALSRARTVLHRRLMRDLRDYQRQSARSSVISGGGRYNHQFLWKIVGEKQEVLPWRFREELITSLALFLV
jgi:hypothetical protein